MLGLSGSESALAAMDDGRKDEGLKVREPAQATDWLENVVRWLVQQVYRKLGVAG